MHITRLAGPLLVIALTAGACTGSAASAAPTAAPASVAPASVAPASAAPAAAAPASAAPSSAAANGDGAGGYDTGGYSKGGSTTPAGGAAAVALAKTGLGTVLVDGKGMTLYMFTPDTATTSACTGGCATNWPPLTGTAPTFGTGLAAADFGSLARADGTTQVTFHGHPLYTFANDQAAGQTNGQGLSGKWYVLGADGNPIK
jgi:predicted lipoprotein with Yx(FWY)xxD motif